MTVKYMTRCALIFLAVSLVLLQTAPQSSADSTKDGLHAKIITDCLADAETGKESACFGKIVETCPPNDPDNGVIPSVCYEQEMKAWIGFIDQQFQLLIKEAQNSEATNAVSILKKSQDGWQEQSVKDCELEVITSPRTYDLEPSCKAERTMKRALFLLQLRGADWTDL